MLFTFAGSDHSKYTHYLLEFICVLEFESSSALREAILRSLLINLSGEPGRFAPADLIQEYFNRLLQAIAERKGVEYNAHFIRNVVSRNLHHLARLRDDLKSGVGLAERSGRHTGTHKTPEIRILLDHYKKQELHTRRPGRTYVSASQNLQPSDFRKGLANLRSGKLSKWIAETQFMRGNLSPLDLAAVRNAAEDVEEEDLDDEDSTRGGDETGERTREGLMNSESEPGPQRYRAGIPAISIVDGELVVETLDIDQEAQMVLDSFESDSEYLWQAEGVDDSEQH